MMYFISNTSNTASHGGPNLPFFIVTRKFKNSGRDEEVPSFVPSESCGLWTAHAV